MFSLQEISKIRDAQGSEQVMDFFGVLDLHIPDKNTIKPTIQNHTLSIDTTSHTTQTSESQLHIIMMNTPQQKDGQIVV